MNPTILSGPARLAWLRARQSGIGSSDAPNLVGVGFRDAMAVYRDKTEPVSERPAAGYLRRGLELEPVVAQMYEEVMGVPLAASSPGQEIVRHRERPWQICTPDRHRADDGTPVQLKTVAGFSDEWGDPGTDQIPENYRIERIHELGVLGAERVDLIALDVIAWEPRVYRVLFDQATWDWLTEVEAEFWDRVRTGSSIPADWEQKFALPPVRLRNDTIDLGDDMVAIFEQRKAVAVVRDEAEAEVKRLNDEIEAGMGEYKKAVAGRWRVTKVVNQGGKEVSYISSPSKGLRITAAKERIGR